MTNADLLRQAAALMRERAEAATPGPWEYDPADMDPGVWSDAGDTGTWVVNEWNVREHNAIHIASWHPAVALAVADWLERVVGDAEVGIFDQFEDALPIARAYLGADS